MHLRKNYYQSRNNSPKFGLLEIFTNTLSHGNKKYNRRILNKITKIIKQHQQYLKFHIFHQIMSLQ